MALRERLIGNNNGSPGPVSDGTGQHSFQEMKARLHRTLINRMDLTKLQTLTPEQVHAEVSRLAESVLAQEAMPLSGDAGLGEIRDMIQKGTLPQPAARRGTRTSRNVLDAYISHVFSFIDKSAIKPFTCVLDAGSGMGGLVAPRIFEQLPCKVIPMCMEVDGRFPSHEANPLIEQNRAHIVERVLKEKADVGIAWDGDADRCFFIDGNGDFVSGDFITALLAEAFLMKYPGSTIVYDLRASHAVKDTVERLGGTAIMNRVGHSFIKKTMREKDGIFGGEVTGHYYFRDNFYADNGFIPAVMLLELMSKKGQSLAELLAPLNARYFISGEINTKVASMDVVKAKLDGIASRYANATVSRLDGVSIDYSDWHFNVRPSNTEPLLRLNLEAATPDKMAAKRDEVLGFIRN